MNRSRQDQSAHPTRRRRHRHHHQKRPPGNTRLGRIWFWLTSLFNPPAYKDDVQPEKYRQGARVRRQPWDFSPAAKVCLTYPATCLSGFAACINATRDALCAWLLEPIQRCWSCPQLVLARSWLGPVMAVLLLM